MVSQRFRISRDDAARLVAAWLKQTDPDPLRDVVMEAAAQAVSRDELPAFVQARLPPTRAGNAAADTGSRSRHPEAEGVADDDPAWQRVRQRLRQDLGEAPFQAWLQGVGYQGCDDGTAVLVAPTRQVADRVRSHYADRLRAAWQAEAAGVRAVRIEVADRAAVG